MLSGGFVFIGVVCLIAPDEEYNDGFRVTISVFGQSPPARGGSAMGFL